MSNFFRFGGTVEELAEKLNEGDYSWKAWRGGSKERVYCKDARGREKGYIDLAAPGWWKSHLSGNTVFALEAVCGRGERELPEEVKYPKTQTATTPAAIPEGRNKREQHCSECGVLCAPGEGVLENIEPDEEERPIWHVFCADRPACATRKEARKAEQAERLKRAAERRAVFSAIREEFRTGERPKLQALPRGDEVRWDENTRFIFEPEHVWLVVYNGRDGDDWSPNNIAGAWIGWRLPRAEEIEKRVRAL